MSDSTTGRTETLDDWLQQWDLHGGWRVSSEEARRLVTEIRALRIASTHHERFVKRINALVQNAHRLTRESLAYGMTVALSDLSDNLDELEGDG